MAVEVTYVAPKHAVVLAGGFGTRLRSLVNTVPKPLASVAGKPFLSHLFDYWSSQGITRFTLLVGYLYEKITEYYGSGYAGVEIDYSIESEPLGTGGALRHAIATLDVEGPTILLLNGDTFFPVSLEQLFKEHTEARADASISLFCPQDFSRYASVITDERRRVMQFTSMPPEFTGNAIERPYGGANGGVYLFDYYWLRNSLSAFPSRFSLEFDFFPSVLSSGDKVFAFPFYNYLCDIGVPEDFLRANHELSEKGTYGN
jgi:D-glycero-alpha-D-manno-heptose 1-phosphate guanylyltransferase